MDGSFRSNSAYILITVSALLIIHRKGSTGSKTVELYIICHSLVSLFWHFKTVSFLSFQMTCVRILEILPAVFERLYPSFIKQPGFSGIVKSAFDFSWLHDLVDWGKSSLKVVLVYWKRTVMALLKLLKESCNSTAVSTIMGIENLISCGKHFVFIHSF